MVLVKQRGRGWPPPLIDLTLLNLQAIKKITTTFPNDNSKKIIKQLSKLQNKLISIVEEGRGGARKTNTKLE